MSDQRIELAALTDGILDRPAAEQAAWRELRRVAAERDALRAELDATHVLLAERDETAIRLRQGSHAAIELLDRAGMARGVRDILHRTLEG